MADVEPDSIMDLASAALARRDYLECEDLCLRALAGARGRRDWADYCRVLLPLQESRRHRRMIAAEGVVRLGSSELPEDLTASLAAYPAACLVVTLPHGRAEAQAVLAEAHRARRFVEVLLADNAASAPRWLLRPLTGPEIACEIAAPPAAWINRWLGRSAALSAAAAATPGAAPTPADWFLDAGEALGDQALAQVIAPPGTIERVEALERCLDVATDHELIHQRLWDAARALCTAR
jgi:hypothetical protein